MSARDEPSQPVPPEPTHRGPRPPESSQPVPAPPEPTRELVLAHALEACLRAERRRPGSSEEVIAHVPPSARAELRALLQLALAVRHTAAEAQPSPSFRSRARERLFEQIAPASVQPVGPRLSTIAGTAPRRRRRWMMGGGAVLVAAALVASATVSASASALPGDPLYGLKKAQEELNMRLAADDQARVLSMLQHADARLDETSRLIAQGRAEDAAATTQQYDQTIQRATSTYVITLDSDSSGGPSAAPMQNHLNLEEQRLEAILAQAPEPVRADLREALVTTQRGQELVADPRPVERALGRRPTAPLPVAAAEPTVAPTAAPTLEPTALPTPTQPTLAAVPAAVVADDHEEDVVAPSEEASVQGPSTRAARSADGTSKRGQGRGQPSRVTPQEEAPPAVEAHDEERGSGAASTAATDERQRAAPAVVVPQPAPPAHKDEPVVAQSATKPAGHAGGESTSSGPPQTSTSAQGAVQQDGGGHDGHAAAQVSGGGGNAPARPAATPTPVQQPKPGKQGGDDNAGTQHGGGEASNGNGNGNGNANGSGGPNGGGGGDHGGGGHGH